MKDYKASSNEHIKEWLKEFDEEVYNIANLSCSLDLDAVPLTRDEYVAILRDKLSTCTKKELLRAFEAHTPKLEWSTVTIKQLKDVLLTQFGDKEPDISSVFKSFGPNCFKKPKDMKVRKFFALWKERLPLCLQPSTDDEHKKLTDLILRCIFYRALDDEYLQKELCNLKGPDITLQQFFDEAVNAEAKRSNFENTSEKGNSLDPAGAISINKYDYSSRGGSNNGYRGGNSYRGRRGHSRGGGGGADAAASDVEVLVM